MGCILAEHRKVRWIGTKKLVVSWSDADALYLREVVVVSGTILTEGSWRVIGLRELRNACLAALGIGDSGNRGSLSYPPDDTGLAFDY